MKNEFIPYESALELKDLDFDEPCFAHFVKHYDEIKCILNSDDFDEWWTNNSDNLNVKAPLYQQAFRWFRDKHNIDAWVQPFMMEKHGTPFLPDESYGYWIFKDGVLVTDEVDFLNPEEAELACLKKLIEIVKTNTK